jgi:LacI family transcriptional regulator
VVNVVTDHCAVGAMAAEHLLHRGLQQFAYCGFDDWWWSRRRKEGFTKTIEQAGFQVEGYQLPRAKAKRAWNRELPLIAEWLRTLREKLIKIGAMVIRHSRYVVFQMAEVAVPRDLFGIILDRIGQLRASPG